uniref:reverse transcriptase domain-containing protein n=1 Tax=Klebsiella pneumoniae TaxID=573 RepID=UPI0025A02200
NVKVGLRQGCVMSPWLFNVFMDGVMKEVQRRVGEAGASLWDAKSNCAWKLGWLMYADDTKLVADSEAELQKLVEVFENVCQKRKLSVNVSKSKVMTISGSSDEEELNVFMGGRRMEEVRQYRYL